MLFRSGTFSTRAKAEAGVEELLESWESDGGDRADVVYEILEDIVR